MIFNMTVHFYSKPWPKKNASTLFGIIFQKLTIKIQNDFIMIICRVFCFCFCLFCFCFCFCLFWWGFFCFVFVFVLFLFFFCLFVFWFFFFFLSCFVLFWFFFFVKFWAKSADVFLRKLEFCKKTRFYPIPVGFTTVTHVYHVDKAQLRLNVDQCTWNLHNIL